jgi:hypothetical protein
MEPTDPGLITLREERDHLSIQISLLKDSANPDPMQLFEMQRQMDLLDRRIERHRLAPDA